MAREASTKTLGVRLELEGCILFGHFFPKLYTYITAMHFVEGGGNLNWNPPAQGQRVQTEIQPEIGISEVSQPRQGFR